MKKLLCFSGLLLLIQMCGIAQAREALLQTTSNPLIKQGYVDTSEGQLHYWEAGTGEPFLLIHQSSSSVEEYAGLVPYLSDDYRLVAFDWPGHGNSDDPARELGVDDFTRSAVAVLDHLGIERSHVLGHHGGALIAMNLAWKYPNRVDKIILSGTSGVKNEAEAEEFTASLDLERRNLLDREGKSLSDAWDRYLNYLPSSEPEDILIPYINNVVARVRPYDAHYGVLRWDRRPALEAIKDRSILLMQGSYDQFVSHQETLQNTLKNSERIVVENAGTFMFFENPEDSAAVMATYLGK